MKCLEDPKNGECRRVSETKVFDLLNKGWNYIPKSKWKTSTDTTWKKSSTPANPTSPNKLRSKELRKFAFENSRVK